MLLNMPPRSQNSYTLPGGDFRKHSEAIFLLAVVHPYAR